MFCRRAGNFDRQHITLLTAGYMRAEQGVGCASTDGSITLADPRRAQFPFQLHPPPSRHYATLRRRQLRLTNDEPRGTGLTQKAPGCSLRQRAPFKYVASAGVKASADHDMSEFAADLQW